MIRGERLYLRSIERDDLSRCHDWMNDPDLRATLAQRYPMSLAQEADWVERVTRGQDPSEMTFAICLIQGDRHIGNCDLTSIDRDNGTATVGILIGEADCRGQGLGEEAVRTLCRFGFDEMRLHEDSPRRLRGQSRDQDLRARRIPPRGRPARGDLPPGRPAST